MTLRWNTQAVKLGAAALIGVVGVALAWRAIGPAPRPLADVEPGASTTPAARQAPLPRSFETTPTLESVESVAASIVQRLEQSMAQTSDPGLTAEQRERFLHEAAALLPIYISGAHARYAEYVAANDGRLDGVTTGVVTPDSIKESRGFWNAVNRGFTLQPVSVEESFVRARWIRGAESPVQDLGDPISVHGDVRYGLPQDAERARLTVYEIIVPLLYERGDTKGPVWLGFALAWADAQQKWLPWRNSVYDPAGIGVLTCPTF